MHETRNLQTELLILLNQVLDTEERVVVHAADGAALAAIVPIEDLRLLERLIAAEEDRLDIKDADRILADPSEQRIPLEEVEARLARSPAPAAADRAPLPR